jgi:hypothetical protein
LKFVLNGFLEKEEQEEDWGEFVGCVNVRSFHQLLRDFREISGKTKVFLLQLLLVFVHPTAARSPLQGNLRGDGDAQVAVIL